MSLDISAISSWSFFVVSEAALAQSKSHSFYLTEDSCEASSCILLGMKVPDSWDSLPCAQLKFQVEICFFFHCPVACKRRCRCLEQNPPISYLEAIYSHHPSSLSLKMHPGLRPLLDHSIDTYITRTVVLYDHLQTDNFPCSLINLREIFPSTEFIITKL